MENMKKDISPELFELANRPASENEVIARPSLTFFQDVKRSLFANKGAVAGMIVLAFIVLMAIFAPMMSSHSYKEQDLQRAKMPPRIQVLENISFLPFDGYDQYGNNVYEDKGIDEYYWFGTDDLGRDIWVRTWQGTRVSLFIGVMAAIIDMVMGVTYGGISAFYGGKVDTAMQRFMEILAGIPYLIVVILFILVFDAGIKTIILAMCVTGWIGMSRVVRGQVLKLKNQEYVLASQTLGASNTKLIIKHLIPNVMSSIIVMAMFTVPSAIFSEAFLSFIGLGLKPPLASLGTLVNDGQKSLQTFPHMLMYPALVLSLIILCFNLVADGLRDALDPKMRK